MDARPVVAGVGLADGIADSLVNDALVGVLPEGVLLAIVWPAIVWPAGPHDLSRHGTYSAGLSGFPFEPGRGQLFERAERAAEQLGERHGGLRVTGQLSLCLSAA